MLKNKKNLLFIFLLVLFIISIVILVVFRRDIPEWADIKYNSEQPNEGYTYWTRDLHFIECNEDDCRDYKYTYDKKENIVHLENGSYQEILEWDNNHIKFIYHDNYRDYFREIELIK